ncbi:helix-turn-helix domain-containing protein [Pedobacter hartonius]|uniref:Helix-turn-helix n=1 Tax=Pedobacter hartonius TaxID=425514 RepID=A0A1H4BUZ0_9SPHI|nr:helix-turn-helix transcriptional regulator [Pedobacter hartonius]SEA51976.1 Helix-turn-helix [Pedobacter hartonius]
MSILSENLRYLRAQKKCSQQHVANGLIISRGRYAKYEDGKSEPPLDILKLISIYFKVSIDFLISADLRNVPEGDRELVYCYPGRISNIT